MSEDNNNFDADESYTADSAPNYTVLLDEAQQSFLNTLPTEDRMLVSPEDMDIPFVLEEVSEDLWE